MSKRNSSQPSNTLFKYFSKTPPANKKTKSVDEDLNGSPSLNSPANNENDSKPELKKRERQSTESPKCARSDDEDDIPIMSKRRKRIRLNPVDSDDSDAENKVDNSMETDSPKPKPSLTKLQDSFKFEQSPKTRKDPATPKTTNEATPKSKAKPMATPAKPETQSIPSEDGDWIHCRLDWLKPEKIRDANKRRPDHPDYDPKTLYVPPDFYKDQTPAHRQWWEMKSTHFDCVLFFKVGKFYELYHMDAAVGVNELGFSYMKGEFAHSGFPESAYARMADTLVARGHKVARVEQTETPDMMQERCKRTGKTSKHDKVVRREICQVSVLGAQVSGVQGGAAPPPGAAYMMCVAEEESSGVTSYGVCFVEASLGRLTLGQFPDDCHASRLLTALAHYPPALLLYDRKTTSARTVNLLTMHCHSARREPQQIWAPEKTLKILAEKYYKTDCDGDWPEGLKPFLHDGDALGLTPAPNCDLAIKALGGCVAFLTEALLDIQILCMAQFESYSPPDVLNQTLSQEDKVKNHKKWDGGSTMVLDAITLKNLRIVQDEGCLYDKLNFCSTAFGKRLLYQWVCAPSCNLTVIKERQEAVKTLMEDQELCQEAQSLLTTLPDLERLLAKVHALGNLKRSKDHPDARAIFYEEKTYTKRKVLDFISVLNGFTNALKLNDLFSKTDSVLLKTITQFRPEGRFPDYRETLQFFKQSFNQEQAEKEGKILPGRGVDPEYDASLRLIADIEQELQEYLKEQELFFKCRVNYVGSDKKRYQLEVSENGAKRAGGAYLLEGSRKGFKRYSTRETKEFLARMMAAEDQKSNVLKDLNRRIFEKFSTSYDQWEAAVKCVAILDVLLSFAEFARQQSGDVCLPDVSYDGEKHFIKITEGRHPCIPIVEEFIPNDTSLGSEGPALMLLTGPNMGGKSTLMRQVGLLTVLAHLGSYVPASACSLTLVDRVFTRLGANDAVLAGQSTFLVEMSESAAIVKHATRSSLILIDELGRGTSTYDGTAIATAVCAALAERGARGLFSTHYHGMVRLLAGHAAVTLAHMACMVETDETTQEEDDENIPEETITFLYKLTPGACPKSYGFNAAFLAGIPRDITRRARGVARGLERGAARRRAAREVLRGGNVREALAALTI